MNSAFNPTRWTLLTAMGLAAGLTAGVLAGIPLGRILNAMIVTGVVTCVVGGVLGAFQAAGLRGLLSRPGVVDRRYDDGSGDRTGARRGHGRGGR